MNDKVPVDQTANYFFDVHSHAFTISHAGILSYINHFLKGENYTFKDVIDENPANIVYHLAGFDPENKKVFDAKSFANKYIIYFLIAILTLTALSILLYNIQPWMLIIPVGIFIGAAVYLSYVISRRANKIRSNYKKNITKPINLLSIMENDIGSALLRMEWDVLALDPDLKNIKLENQTLLYHVQQASLSEEKKNQVRNLWENYINQKGGFKISETSKRYKKYVLTPLIVDFGYKEYNIEGIHYKRPPSKPVVTQIIDTFSGIQSYFSRSPFQIFRIFPFMGINPNHYQLKPGDESEHENSIEQLFEKYFSTFTNSEKPDERIEAFSQKLVDYSDDLDLSIEEKLMHGWLKSYNNKIVNNTEQGTALNFTHFLKDYLEDIDIGKELKRAQQFYNHFFVGIKLYPPLGVDPWPDDETSVERKKVIYLYEKCIEYNLPIITHCNFGGFTVDTDANIELFTNPKRWEEIFKKYPKLKVDFAHIGGDHQGNAASAKIWRDKIFDYIIEYEHVYTDFSCMCFHDKDYLTLKNWIEDYLKARPDSENNDKHRQKIYHRIMYGTDFSINLLFDTNSYEEYLYEFTQTKHFSDDVKSLFSEENPYQFLFG